MLTLSLIALGTLAISAGGDLNAKTNGVHVTTLLRTPVASVDGQILNVSTVELTPGATDSRQSSPGVELVYVLNGAGRLEIDGKPPLSLDPGVVARLNPNQSHVLKNTSQTQTLNVLVVYLIEKGQQRPSLSNRATPGKTAESGNQPQAGLVF
jgi:quercetin dioxygenase-like cupin family protein